MSVNRVDYLAFIRNQRIYTKVYSGGSPSIYMIRLSTIELSDDDSDIDLSLSWAQSIVAIVINTFNAIDYEMAVYNVAMHWLILNGNAEIFDTIRTSLNTWALHSGFVQSTSDEGTSVSNQLPAYLQNLSAGDMQFMQTQSGRNYMAIVSRYRDLINFDA